MVEINDKAIIGEFPDNTPLIKLLVGAHVTDVWEIKWKYDNMGELFVIKALVDKIRTRKGNVPIKLIMPYIPNGRMDRTVNKDDVFTLKSMCDVINNMDFCEVEVYDSHSNVSLALLNRSVDLYDRKIKKLVENIIDKEVDIIFYPDNGAANKYSKIYSREHVFGVKIRDWNTGEIKGLDVFGDVKDKNILIIDDICSAGGTFYHSAKKLKELGAKDISLFVTHCENTILTGQLIDSGLIKKIYTTDSIFRKEHKLIDVVYIF